MQTTLKVEGMVCEHCSAAVAGALKALDGVEDVTVNLTDGTVTVRHAPSLTAGKLGSEIEEQGFEVIF